MIEAWHSLCFFARRRPSSSDMNRPRFRKQNVRRVLSFLEERLWLRALVLSMQLVPAHGWHRRMGGLKDEAPTSLMPVMSEGRLEAPLGRPVHSPAFATSPATASAIFGECGMLRGSSDVSAVGAAWA